jgi:hypothetical protein
VQRAILQKRVLVEAAVAVLSPRTRLGLPVVTGVLLAAALVVVVLARTLVAEVQVVPEVAENYVYSRSAVRVLILQKFMALKIILSCRATWFLLIPI